jgi:hypothetical protein
LPDSLIAQLAEEHARVYDEKTGACFFVFTDTGWKFYTSEETTSANKHDAAQRNGTDYRAQATQHRQEQSRRRTQDRGQTRVAEAGRCILKLNKSEIDRLMKYIGRGLNLWDNLSQTTHGATSVALFLFRRFNHVCTLHTY